MTRAGSVLVPPPRTAVASPGPVATPTAPAAAPAELCRKARRLSAGALSTAGAIPAGTNPWRVGVDALRDEDRAFSDIFGSSRDPVRCPERNHVKAAAAQP